MKKLSIIILLSSLLFSVEFMGSGSSQSKKEAKRLALEDLSAQISADVKSKFKTVTNSLDGDYKKDRTKILEVSSNLPLRGIEYDEMSGNLLTNITAKISSEYSLNTYNMEINRLTKEIKSAISSLKSLSSDAKYTQLQNILKNIDNLNRNKIVASTLGAKNFPSLDITKSQIQAQLLKLQSSVDSLKLAARVLIKGIDKTDIYISAVKPSTSKEVTQFAKTLKNYLSNYLDSTKKPANANYFIRGNYEILKNSILITISLYDRDDNILKTNTVEVKPKAYSNLAYKPTTKNFDTAMQTEGIRSNKLSVHIGFRGYNRDDGITLRNRDTVDIVIKSNKPICYFLQGYTIRGNKNFSYLLPLHEDGYINKLTGEDVNQMVTIAEGVEVSKPFGNERLQIFAATMKNGKCSLPVPNCYHSGDYCVVGKSALNGVKLSRGLINKKLKNKKIEKTEASISWTSFRN
jgi:hypothetical protein